MTTYRIAVGKRHRVQPGAIVGAIANEGGLRRGDFGHISIRADHSLVELPKDLSPQTLDALRSTRISGVLIQLQPDSGAPSGRPSSYRGRDDRRGDDRRGGDRRDQGKRDRGGKREYGESVVAAPATSRTAATAATGVVAAATATDLDQPVVRYIEAATGSASRRLSPLTRPPVATGALRTASHWS